MTDLAYKLGDFFQWTFGILETLGNLPNYVFIAMGMAGLAAWVMRQQKYLRENRKSGDLI